MAMVELEVDSNVHRSTGVSDAVIKLLWNHGLETLECVRRTRGFLPGRT